MLSYVGVQCWSVGSWTTKLAAAAALHVRWRHTCPAAAMWTPKASSSAGTAGAMPERWQPGHVFSVRPQPASAGVLLAAACSDGALRIWDRGGGAGALTPVAAVRHASPKTPNINPDCKPEPIFKPACSDGALRIWDRGSGAGEGALSPVAAVRHAHPGDWV